jgi:hypothetical protein
VKRDKSTMSKKITNLSVNLYHHFEDTFLLFAKIHSYGKLYPHLFTLADTICTFSLKKIEGKTMTFLQKLRLSVEKTDSCLCVGLDPYLERIPARIIEKYPGPN